MWRITSWAVTIPVTLPSAATSGMWRKPPTAILWIATAIVSSGAQHDRVGRHDLRDGEAVERLTGHLQQHVALGEDALQVRAVADEQRVGTLVLHLPQAARTGVSGATRIGSRPWTRSR